MKRLFVLFSFLFSAFTGFSQKPFFSSIEGLSFLYFDDVYYGPEGWQRLYRPPYKPGTANTNLQFFDKHMTIVGGWGGQIKLTHNILVSGPEKDRILEWKLGAGARTFLYRSGSYQSRDFVADTTKDYQRLSESFSQRFQWGDVYSSLLYSLNGEFLRGSIGLGLLASVQLGKPQIDEYYSSNTSRWNTALQRWEVIQNVSGNIKAAAYRMYKLGFTVPAEFGVLLSRKVTMGGIIEYFHALHWPRMMKYGSSSDGAFFQGYLRLKL